MKANGYNINKHDFRMLLSLVLNPYLVIPGYNTRTPYGISRLLEQGYDFSSMTKEEALEVLAVNALGMPMEFPLELQMDGGQWWKLPFEPLITVKGKNIITKKQVSKGSVRGTIKERWSQDDYSVSIQGLLMGPDGKYPSSDVLTLRRHCEAAKLKVKCPLFECFSINQIVVESFDFPATTGLANQGYRISAVSDDMYQLLLKKEDLRKA